MIQALHNMVVNKFMIGAIDVDPQRTFTPLCPCELPVAGGDLIVQELNAQAALADVRVLTRDAHAPNALWIREQPLLPLDLPHAPESWPAHAIVGSEGFLPLEGLPAAHDYDFLVFKGVDVHMHPYGACFHDIGETISTGLIEWLVSRKVTTVIVGGLATDFCVCQTVLQLLKHSLFKVLVNRAACRAVSEVGEIVAWDEMQNAGACLFDDSQAIATWLNSAGSLK